MRFSNSDQSNETFIPSNTAIITNVCLPAHIPSIRNRLFLPQLESSLHFGTPAGQPSPQKKAPAVISCIFFLSSTRPSLSSRLKRWHNFSLPIICKSCRSDPRHGHSGLVQIPFRQHAASQASVTSRSKCLTAIPQTLSRSLSICFALIPPSSAE